MKRATQLDEEIFSAAIALPASERSAYLASHCGDDPMTLERVRALIDGYEKNSAFLESPAGAGEPRLARDFAGTLPREPEPGDEIGHYRLVERIGEGGFGVVYLAEQTAPVRRRVALKLIRLGLDTREFIARFAAERQALALMDHPGIARVFDAGATDTGRPYLVMEFIRGQPITRYCDEHCLSLRTRLELFLQVCGAIQHAHQKSVIHRDLKPSNILVTDEGGGPAPKLIDFGIAKATREPLTERSLYTQRHAFIGTPAYTSPEQMDIDGCYADTRSDIYSLGALLYELLTGDPPFERETLKRAGYDELRRIVREVEPPRPSARVAAYFPAQRKALATQRSLDPAKFSARLRTDLDWIVMRCLEKDPARRYETASALATDIRHHLDHEPVFARPPSTTYRLGKFIRRHRIGVVANVAIVGAIVVGSLATEVQARRALRAERVAAEARRTAEAHALRLEKIRWARETALPEIARLVKKNDIVAAFALARQAEECLPDDPALTSLWPLISAKVAVETTPSGADIYAKPYAQPAAAWQYLGKSPLKDIRLPRCVHRWRIEKAGYTPIEKADGWPWGFDKRTLVCPLYPSATTPAGMVRVQPRAGLRLGDGLSSLDDFWIDQHEVTNREFKEFVVQGGYANEKFWKNPFVRDGKKLDRTDAMALFHDRTGRPGPANWANGTYLENEADYPVTGISWFEAAAYAEFVGKRLPSVGHWEAAGRRFQVEYILAFANFGLDGPAPAGAYQGINTCGAVDMAGNAKEWCWNEAPGERRYLLGGGWGEADYMFMSDDALSPFDRGPRNGFRCIKTDDGKPVPASIDAPVPRGTVRNYANERPVSDEQFEFIKRAYAYDKTSLEPHIEGQAAENTRWRRERVSFNTAYNGGRMDTLLYFPRSARPPYQALVYFPGIGARFQRSSESPHDLPVIETLLETGRAVVYPIYEGTYERPMPAEAGEAGHRVWLIHLVRDVRRTIDYLDSRTDLTPGQVAFVGLSWGAELGPIIAALEDRIKVNVFIGGGFAGKGTLPEADPFNFASRVTVPTLMINGRQDFIRPLETSQLPLLRALGTSAEHKRHLLVEGGHLLPVPQAAAEIRDWLDRYLGTVNEAGSN
jgi:serine/threonine protein kinase/dienelactone hydrolase